MQIYTLRNYPKAYIWRPVKIFRDWWPKGRTRTITETLEIARDVARKLLEAKAERHRQARLTSTKDSFDYPLIPGT